MTNESSEIKLTVSKSTSFHNSSHSASGTISNEIFPGVFVHYINISGKRDYLYPACSNIKELLTVGYCKSGRCELYSNEKYYYTKAGDIFIYEESLTGRPHKLFFPQSYYEGITITIDISKASASLSFIFDDADAVLNELKSRYCKGKLSPFTTPDEITEKIFLELCSDARTAGNNNTELFRLKVPWLLFMLKRRNIAGASSPNRGLLRSQVLLAKGVCEYMMQNMDKRITIDQLALLFHISPTQLKKLFRNVFGTSVYAYLKAQKMYSAAEDLKNTDMSILKIAGKYGYENGSKFAKAFRETMGTAPKAYRTSQKK